MFLIKNTAKGEDASWKNCTLSAQIHYGLAYGFFKFGFDERFWLMQFLRSMPGKATAV